MNKVRLTLLALTALGLSLPAVAGIPSTLEPGDLLGSTGNLGTLVEIDPATGASSTRCSLGSLGPVTEIVYGPDGTLYGTTGGGGASLITIDPDTCAETLIGQHSFGSINGLAFVGGTLYGTYFAPPEGGPLQGEGPPPTFLVTLDLGTGQETVIGQLGSAPWRGLAYDASSDQLFAAAIVGPAVVGGGDTLMLVDPTDASTTLIGSVGFEVGGMRFDDRGTLYGAVPMVDTATTGTGVELITIDLATGVGTPVGATNEDALSGLAFVPALGGGPSPLEIPALGSIGAGALLLLLGLSGLVALRRA